MASRGGRRIRWGLRHFLDLKLSEAPPDHSTISRTRRLIDVEKTHQADYWWLAFDVRNFRIACPFANSPKHNEEHGCAGGKGDNFPLIPPSVRGTDEESIKLERPVILDPCKKEDCDLLAFQADGRPILHPLYADDPVAKERVETSKILLNIDHPDFNSKREQLYHDIADDVKAYEALPENSEQRTAIRNRMERRLAANAPFSTAARYYLQVHRNLDWGGRVAEDAVIPPSHLRDIPILNLAPWLKSRTRGELENPLVLTSFYG